MIKKLNIVIENICKYCPFCQYETWYMLGDDSGYDCKYPKSKVSRIVNDGEIRTNFNSKTNGWPPIPENCPLDNNN